MMKHFLVAVLALGLFAGCKKETCGYDECAIKAPASEIQAVQNYLTSQNITNAVEHCSGLFYVIDTLGTGQYPNACAGITARYKGMLTSGVVFDQGNISFSLREVITGWRNGIPLVRAGGKIRLFIPPTLGYGSQGFPPDIPGNAILIFE